MTDKSKIKRERSANFSADEISTLVSIIAENKEIIECKKTDATTWRTKDKAWDIVTDSFNSCSAIPRTKKALRTKYEDIKKNIRKKNSHNRMERFKTGGGVPTLQNLTSTEESVAQIMGSTVDGQPSIWDSDNIPELRNMDTVEDVNINYVDNEDEKMLDDSPLLIEFENEEYLEECGNREETCEKNETILHKDIPSKGVSVLKRPIAPEVRPMKKTKRSKGAAQQDNCGEARKELHKMRMSVLQKEFEVNEARLLAAQLDIEIKEQQKKNEMARLRKQLE